MGVSRKGSQGSGKKADNSRNMSPEEALEAELKDMEERLGKCHIEMLPLFEELRSIYIERGKGEKDVSKAGKLYYSKAAKYCRNASEACKLKYGTNSAEYKEWYAKTTASERMYRGID